jgi:hypothetical protein
MSDASPTPPESPPEALAGRLASLVHIMKGRSSLFSRLGVLELDAGLLSLWDAAGTSLFAVPVGSVQARPQPRRLAVHQYFFQVRAAERWWYLAGAVPTKYARRSTRELVQRYGIPDRVPMASGMSGETYLRLTSNPTTHQVLWVGCWLAVLRRLGAGEP